ncbi:MAG: pyruvate:ferredoxin (flavodoxin) oxidoreductase [Chloroflexota bacterium]
MKAKQMITIDGNEAAARVAYKLSEVIAIYPITPSSLMGEFADQWAAEGQPNLWGTTPLVVEMQSEGGAAGAVHGALQTGALTTTFTASQGLLLMIPNMYKIAGELTPTVFHIAARSVAAHALSIFGDHSDVMAVRNTGFALLASNSIQEVSDMALIASAATLEARLPFLHFFDGFRTSHEVAKMEPLTDEVLRAMVSEELVQAHRSRALNPDSPFVRGTAQNPDVFFQGRERSNPYYLACPGVVQKTMDRFAEWTGRHYHLFDYVGAPDAERVLVLMGSGAEAAEETVEYLANQGQKVGVVKVRLYRPFDGAAFVRALPPTVKAIAVLDRTKEPGAVGEPLYLDVVAALHEYSDELKVMSDESGSSLITHHSSLVPVVIGGRYGLSSKEFTPAMIRAVLEELAKPKPKNHFTVGIYDDVTHTSLEFDPEWHIESPDTVRALFYGLGSDGTVGANKNSIKIIGEYGTGEAVGWTAVSTPTTDLPTAPPLHAQGYFVYDSKKSGSVTVSHLRFGSRPIHASYLIQSANFVACHQFNFLERYDMLRLVAPGGVFLLNSPYGPVEVWDYLPRSVQQTILDKQLRFYVIDGYSVAKEAGMGRRINTVMQTCFFAISGVLPREEAIAAIKQAIEKTYGKRGEVVVEQNFAAVDATLAHLYEVEVPAAVTSTFERPPVVPAYAPEFVQSVTARMIEGLGDQLPVSAMPADGTFPAGTTKWEKRNITDEIPVWDKDICIQCGKCVYICPHAVIRMKVYDPALLTDAPPTFQSAPARYKEYKDMAYTLQVAPEDCTGCTLCVEICPVKNKRVTGRKAINMTPQRPLRESERANWEFFLSLPEVDRATVPLSQVKYSQLLEPLFEFSLACSGCGETPYLKLLSQLFGERAYVANATGCSSIYGGNLPTTPWTKNADGRGPAWSNSLFEDNAEFGYGMRVALDQRMATATNLLRQIIGDFGFWILDFGLEEPGIQRLKALADEILYADQQDEAAIQAQRRRVAELKALLTDLASHITDYDLDPSKTQNLKSKIQNLLSLAEVFVKKSVWIVGGDGWAYDIGYGGLDHVLASGRNVNVLVLDTEVYSNTGGQMSKATPRGAVAKFAAAGKPLPKKDLGLLAISYGNVYVARVAMGADDAHTSKAFLEAEAYDGPSLILAYSHCIAHGYDMKFGLEQQKAAVSSGYWPLYRFNPDRVAQGLNPFQLDSKPPSLPLEQYVYREGRYRMLTQSHPEAAARLLELAKVDVDARWANYLRLADGQSGK